MTRITEDTKRVDAADGSVEAHIAADLRIWSALVAIEDV